jgi:transcription elongation GreA/GreB family factor
VPYYFLAKDYDALIAKIEALNHEMEEAGQEKGRMAEQTSETWHDNFGFEDQERAQMKISKRLEDFIEMKNEAELVVRHLPDEVGIGAFVTIEDERGQTRRFKVSSYQVLDQEDEAEVSYAAPLAKPFLGAKVGDSREVEIGDETTRYRVTAIE